MDYPKHQTEHQHPCIIRGVTYQPAVLGLSLNTIVFIFEPIVLALKIHYSAMRHLTSNAHTDLEYAIYDAVLKAVQNHYVHDMIVGDLNQVPLFQKIELKQADDLIVFPPGWDHQKIMNNLIEVYV
jgi:hypothetical protein